MLVARPASGPAPLPAVDPAAKGPAAVFSCEPLILSTISDRTRPLGFTVELGSACADRDAVFLLTSAWDGEDEETSRIKVAAARNYRAHRPRHEIIFLGNTPREVEFLRAAGADAFFSSHNLFVSEAVFRPLPEATVAFDAVYSARPIPMKRHELAGEIERVVYVSYPSPTVDLPKQQELLARLAAKPGHVVLNAIVAGMPEPLPPVRVNEVLAQAAIGLCLSAVEGAMYSSMEYLMAGLPVVSTPSLGGRDIFFDPDYCLIADPNPRAIREAVTALGARAIPRDYVRARTLGKVQAERQRFLALLETIQARHGVPRRFETEWRFAGSPMHRWRSLRDHARDFDAARPVDTARDSHDK